MVTDIQISMPNYDVTMRCSRIQDPHLSHPTRGQTSIQAQILDQNMDQEERVLLSQLKQEMLQVQCTKDLFMQPTPPMLDSVI
jgi:hypothetical protein